MTSSVIDSCILRAGIREGHLQKALQRVRPNLPTAASLAAATAAAEAAKQRVVQRALPKLASSASLATSAQIEEESQQPSATTQAEAVPAGAASSAPEDMAATAPAGSSVAAPAPTSAVTAPCPMDIDTAPAQDSRSAQIPGLQPESSSLTAADLTGVAKSEEGQKAENSKQAVEQLPASELERSVKLSSIHAIHVGMVDFSAASMTEALYTSDMQLFFSGPYQRCHLSTVQQHTCIRPAGCIAHTI